MYNFSSKLWYNKRSQLANGDYSIYLQVVINGDHKEINLKLRWPGEKINLAKGVLEQRYKGDPDVEDYNLLIRMEEAKHTEILRTYRIKKAPLDLKIFSKELRIFDKRESFVGYMLRESLSRYSKKEISKRTWQNSYSAVTLMREFDDAWLFEYLSLSWMKKFKSFLQNKQIGKDNSESYQPGHIWTVIKNIKTYLNLALLEPMIYVDPAVVSFPNPEPEWDTVFLNKDEVRRLMVLLKVGGLGELQEQVLRAFLFTCFTSLRISDVYRVNSGWRLSEGFLDFIPKKNEKKKRAIHIPIMPIANQFIKRDLGLYFELPSEPEYNLKLKELAMLAEINKNVTSHVGRHTFGHFYMTKVGNLKGLQEILGHKKIETTMRYAHLDDEYKTDSVKLIQNEFADLMLRVI